MFCECFEAKFSKVNNATTTEDLHKEDEIHKIWSA